MILYVSKETLMSQINRTRFFSRPSLPFSMLKSIVTYVLLSLHPAAFLAAVVGDGE